MKTRHMGIIASFLFLHTSGLGTVHGQAPRFSLFEYDRLSDTAYLKWISGTNALYELESSTNLSTGLWGHDAGGTNVLGTRETNSVHVACDDYPNQFFRLVTRSNSPQESTFIGMAFRANSTLLFDRYSGVDPWIAPVGSWVGIWTNSYYYTCNNASRSGWIPRLEVTSNQSFYYFPAIGTDRPSGWTHAYIKDWRLIAPEDLPVTGDVLIEWSAFDRYGTPENPTPEIPFFDVTIMDLEGGTVTNWPSLAPDTSSVTWESQGNPDGYYTIKVNVAGLEILEKQVYLYN